jgi:hypothetical protein
MAATFHVHNGPMIKLQIIERSGAKLHRQLVAAMRDGDLKTFKTQKRGKKVVHTNASYPGWMNWSESKGVISCEILSPKKPGHEWRLLSALVGRLADRYSGDVHGINIQFASE